MNEHKTNLPSLTELCQRLRAHGITLRWDITLSSKLILISNKPIPAQLRRTIWMYSREVLICLILGDIRLCRDPELHRPSWYRLSKQFYCCDVCYDRGLDNDEPLHKVPDIVFVQTREEDEVVA